MESPLKNPEKYKWDFAVHPDKRPEYFPIVIQPVDFIPPRGLELFWYNKYVNNKKELYRDFYKKKLLTGEAKKWMDKQLRLINRPDLIIK